MCGRYTLAESQKLPKRYNTKSKLHFEPSYNIAPGMMNPVVRQSNDLMVIELMKWGLVPFWAKDTKIGYKMINARSESIEDKPAFRQPIRQKRCLVPASGFYEWKTLNLEGKDEKYPWYFKIKGVDIFSLAGIYDIWKDKEGHEMRTYSIITTEANSEVKKVHNRMPVIIEPEQEEKWLKTKTPLQKVLSLLIQVSSDKMISYPVSRRVNNPRNDDKELIKEITRD